WLPALRHPLEFGVVAGDRRIEGVEYRVRGIGRAGNRIHRVPRGNRLSGIPAQEGRNKSVLRHLGADAGRLGGSVNAEVQNRTCRSKTDKEGHLLAAVTV